MSCQYLFEYPWYFLFGLFVIMLNGSMFSCDSKGCIFLTVSSNLHHGRGGAHNLVFHAMDYHLAIQTAPLLYILVTYSVLYSSFYGDFSDCITNWGKKLHS